MLLDPYRFKNESVEANASLNPHNFPVTMWDSPNTAFGSNTAHNFPVSMISDSALRGSNTAHDFPVSMNDRANVDLLIGSNTAHDFPVSMANTA